jgi:hypothetical protein
MLHALGVGLGGLPGHPNRDKKIDNKSMATRPRVFVRKCVAPIHALIVPNGCSTVCRRSSIVSGA